MQQGFLQIRAHILRRSVRDPVCAPCRVFVFLALLFLNALRADCIFFDICVDSVGSPVIPGQDGRVASEASISARNASEPRGTAVCRGFVFHALELEGVSTESGGLRS